MRGSSLGLRGESESRVHTRTPLPRKIQLSLNPAPWKKNSGSAHVSSQPSQNKKLVNRKPHIHVHAIPNLKEPVVEQKSFK